MPCNAEHMGPTQREIQLSRVLCFHDELDGKQFPHSHWQGYHPFIYGKKVSKEDADSWVAHLYHRCGNIDVTRHSLELQIWWRDHQKAGKQRKAKEEEDAQLELKRQVALAKLSQEDLEVLGLEKPKPREKSVQRTYYFDTGVQPKNCGRALRSGEIWKNGTKRIKFECEDVPKNATLIHISPVADMKPYINCKGIVIRPVLNSSLTGFAYFRVPIQSFDESTT